MGKAYKNFWSLNTDEAVVVGILRGSTPKNIEVFMPVNAQMKGVDLVLMNMENKKTLTIQVKGSRAYEPKKSETVKYGDGSAGWFYFSSDVIHNSSADYFVFLVYVIEENKKAGRRIIYPHTITMPAKELKLLCHKYKTLGSGRMYNFFVWINHHKKEAFDFKDTKYSLSEFLDDEGFKKINKLLSK